jgi:DNA-directed RNA polymerase subunit RPC12/RpoP
MDSSFRFRCPACAARIKAPLQLIGQTRDCPRCGGRLVVKLSPPQDAGPAFLVEPAPAAALGRTAPAF